MFTINEETLKEMNEFVTENGEEGYEAEAFMGCMDCLNYCAENCSYNCHKSVLKK